LIAYVKAEQWCRGAMSQCNVENVLEEEMSCDSLPWHRRSPKLAAEARLAQDKVPHSICQPCSFQQYSIAACNITITIVVQLFEAAAWS
jgi:hypothetical protein